MRPAATAALVAAALVVALGLAGCEATPATQVLVLLDAQGAARARAAALRVRVFDQEGEVVLDQTEPLGPGARLTLPARVPISPRGDDPSRTFLLEGTLLDEAGVAYAWVRVRAGFVRGEIREVAGCFLDVCEGETCGDLAVGCLGGGECETCGLLGCEAAARGPAPLGTLPGICPGGDCAPSATVEEDCGDGRDDDCDGAADCLDADCVDAGCGAAGQRCAGGACACPGGDRETACGDGADEDCDGLTDCSDPDCEGIACGRGGACAGGSCACGTGGFEDTPALCHDGIDNDCDGRVDCEQGDCLGLTEQTAEDCADGVDNDCDGSADCADPDCDVAPERCGNGVDDDCDGDVDCADSECCALPECHGARCGDAVGSQCCPGVGCVDTQRDAQNCGGCGITCIGDRNCGPVPGTSEGACYCAPDTNDCPRDFECRRLQERNLCNCLANDANSCPGGYTCRRNGGPMFHNTCDWTG